MSLKKFENILRRKGTIRILTKTMNTILVFKCLVGILLLLTLISLLMYPLFLAIFYKTVECNISIWENQIEDCIETICEFFYSLVFNHLNYVLF